MVPSRSTRPDPAFANLARDAYDGDLQGLFDAGEQIEHLLKHPGLAHVLRLLDLERSGIDETLNSRLLDSRAEYARLTGRRGGLGAFTAAADAIVQHAQKTLAQQERQIEATAGSVA